MEPRERVLITLQRQEPDRVPYDLNGFNREAFRIFKEKTGADNPDEYFGVEKQKAGKLLYISARAENIERLISDLSPRGLLINTSCENEEEAKELLSEAKKWTTKRLRRQGKY